MLDVIDKQIIDHLVVNARATTSEIAKQLRITQPAVFKRVKKLEERHILAKYDCLLSPEVVTAKKVLYFTNSPDTQVITQNKACFAFYEIFGLYTHMIWCHFISTEEETVFEKSLSKDYIKITYDTIEPHHGTLFDTKIIPPKKQLATKYALDEVDKTILSVLGDGGAKKSANQIAKETGLSIDLVTYRKRKLIKNGYFFLYIAQPGNAFTSFKVCYTILKLAGDMPIKTFTGLITSIKGDKYILLAHYALDFDMYLAQLQEIKNQFGDAITELQTFFVNKHIILNRYRL